MCYKMHSCVQNNDNNNPTEKKNKKKIFWMNLAYQRLYIELKEREREREDKIELNPSG